MATNLSSVNNLACSGSLSISNNIISSGNLQTTNITSSGITNSNTITTNIINSVTANLTNINLSNLLTLLSNTPIKFVYNGSQYNLSSLMLYTLFQLSGANIASQTYVNQQIANLINSSPDLLNTLSELSAAINNDPNFNNTMLTLIGTKAGLTSNNTFTNSNSFTGTNTNINNLYSNILAINNNNVRRSNNDILEVATSSTGNYLYYNNSSTFGLINVTDSLSSWYITSSGIGLIPTLNTSTLNVSVSTFQNLPNYINTSDKLINKLYVDDRFTSLLSSNNYNFKLHNWNNNKFIFKYFSN